MTDFINIQIQFLIDLKNCFPEYTQPIENFLGHVKPKNINKLTEWFINKTKHHEKEIITLDDTIYTNNSQKLEFIPSINFTELMNMNMNNNTRKNILSYLQKLYILANNHQKNTIPNLKDLIDSIPEERTRMDSENQGENITEAVNSMTKMLGISEDSSLNSIIQDIAGTVGEMMESENPLAILNQMQNGGGDKFNEMFQKINGSIQSKIQSGEINEKELTENSMKMQQQIPNLMQQLGGGQGMPDMNALMQQLGQNQGIPQQGQGGMPDMNAMLQQLSGGQTPQGMPDMNALMQQLGQQGKQQTPQGMPDMNALMQQLGQNQGMPDMNALMQQLGGQGQNQGMPDMNALMQQLGGQGVVKSDNQTKKKKKNKKKKGKK